MVNTNSTEWLLSWTLMFIFSINMLINLWFVFNLSLSSPLLHIPPFTSKDSYFYGKLLNYVYSGANFMVINVHMVHVSVNFCATYWNSHWTLKILPWVKLESYPSSFRLVEITIYINL